MRASAKLFAQLEVVIFKAKPAAAKMGNVWLQERNKALFDL